METTKGFIKSYWSWKFAGGFITAWMALFAFTGEGLINYYCNSSIPFFGIRLYSYPDACPVYLTIGYLVVITLAIFLAGLLVSIAIDLIRLKTEKIFQLDANPPMRYPPSRPRWASINITNISREILKNCCVYLVDILDESGESVLDVNRKRKLKWSAGDPPRDQDKEFKPDESHIIDVATTFYSGNKQVTFETMNGEETKNKGSYDVKLIVYGELNGKPRNKNETFTVTYYRRNIITIRRKGDPEWDDLDPQPSKQRKRQNPPVSDAFTS